MTLLIGIRSYLVKDNHRELVFQVNKAKENFPEAKVVVFVCGEKPDKSVYDSADEVVYYSDKAEGPLKPWQLIIPYAKKTEADGLIIVDGDDQHIFSEVKRIYIENKDKADVVIPERLKRVIYISNSDIDRVTVEDLENAYIRARYNTRIKDLQPGLFIMNRRSFNCLDLENASPWADDLIAIDQFYSNGLKIGNPEINARSQRTNTFNKDVVFRRIVEFEHYFKSDFLGLIDAVEKEPSNYLFEGKVSELGMIRKAFTRYKNKQKVHKMKGLVLSGGLGTGLRPITHTTQKQLIPIANKPIIFYVIEDLVSVGIKDIGIIVGPNKEQIKESVGDGSRWGIKISYIEQDAPKGLAHAVKIAQPYLGDSDFVMYLGDNLIKGGIHDFVDNFNNSSADASILLNEVDDPRRFGVAKLDENGKISGLVEKPKDPPSKLAVVGIYAFKKSIFDAIDNIKPSWRDELEITDAMDWLLKNGRTIDHSLVSGWWKDTGKPGSLLEANHLVLDMMDFKIEGEVDPEAMLRGRVAIGKGSIVKKGANIRGPVVIGENCEIGENVYIGPYTSIGDNVKLKSGEIEHSIVLDDSIIESDKRIVDSLVGRDCNIVSSTKKLPSGNMLVIGDNSSIEL